MNPLIWADGRPEAVGEEAFEELQQNLQGDWLANPSILDRGQIIVFFRGVPLRGRRLYFTCPSPPDPLLKAPKAPFLTFRVATSLGAPRQAPLENPPKIGKRGLRSRKTPFSSHPRKSVSSQKIPMFPLVPCIEMGIFLARDALFWGGGGNGGTPKPSVPLWGC